MGRPQDAPAARQRLIAAAGAVAVAFAALVAAPAGARAGGGAEEPVPAGVRAVLDAPDDAARRAAAEALADDDVVASLRDAGLRDRLSAPALQALAGRAAERGLKLANSGLRALLRDPAKPIDVRRAAALALAKTGSIADVAALGDGLADLPDECCRALVAIGGDAAIAILRRSFAASQAPEAAAALAKLGDRAHLATLLPLLQDAATRERAVALLRWATDQDLPADVAAWTGFIRRDGVASGLSAPDQEVAQALVVSLADKIRAGDMQLEGDVAAILADEKSSLFARAKSALVLGLSGVRTRNDVLLAACANGQPGDVRRYAAQALARVGDLRIAVPFANLLVHDEDRDRLASKRSLRVEFVPVDPEFVRAMHRVGIKGGTLAMIDDLVGDYRTGLHRDCLRAIAEVSGGETFGVQPDGSKEDRLAGIERIRAWWKDARETVPVPPPAADDAGWPAFRKGVDLLIADLAPLKFLTQFRAKKALMMVAEAAAPQLEAALSSEDRHIRIGTAEVMEGTALRQFAPALTARLVAETNGAVRQRILAALEQCGRRAKDGSVPGGAATAEAVRAALGAREVDVRIAAARVLGVLGDASDVQRIRAALAEPRNAIDAFRLGAGGALLLLGDRGGIRLLAPALRDEDVAIRADALRYMRAAKVDVHGYDVDASPEARDAAVREIEKNVPPEGRK